MKVKTKVTCLSCHHVFEYDGTYELKDVYDREMGKEYWYEDSFVDILCPNCNCKIKGSISYWEYPEGVLETSDSELTNAKAKVFEI